MKTFSLLNLNGALLVAVVSHCLLISLVYADGQPTNGSSTGTCQHKCLWGHLCGDTDCIYGKCELGFVCIPNFKHMIRILGKVIGFDEFGIKV